MSEKKVDVAVIGAGTSGLSAIAEIRKKTNSFLLINHGAYGTTCARTGCMPSKALIQIANQYHMRKSLSELGIGGGKNLNFHPAAAMAHVRRLRDIFVKSALENTFKLAKKNIEGQVKFLEPNLLRVGRNIIHAKRIIIATGTTPRIPESWRSLESFIITTDQLFELNHFPESMVTIGLGPLGIEMGQALSRLDIKMVGIGRSKKLAGLTDPKVIAFAQKTLASEMKIELEKEPEISFNGKILRIYAGKNKYSADRVLASLGRDPNLRGLGLENIGVEFNEKGVPKFDKNTLKLNNLPIFIAGDVNRNRAVLHEAADEGRIAGYNSVHHPLAFKRRIPITITFCDPNIATVGCLFSDLKSKEFIIGETFFNFGRAIILSQTGFLRIYGEPRSGRILGSEMMVPHGENLAHLIACMIHQKMTVFEALTLPYYHPVIEESLKNCLKNLAKKLRRPRKFFDFYLSP